MSMLCRKFNIHLMVCSVTCQKNVGKMWILFFFSSNGETDGCKKKKNQPAFMEDSRNQNIDRSEVSILKTGIT